MDETLAVMRGKREERVPSEQVRVWARGFERTVLDVGTGDGRWLYRQARAHPGWACIGIDANPDRMREVSFRAGRKPARGGVRNLLFVRASVDALPQALHGVADEIYILYPWGSLLDAVWTPRAEALSAIGSLAKPGGRLEVRVNPSAVVHRTANVPALVAGYAAGGIRLREVRIEETPPPTSWARRLANGYEARVILLEATVAGA
jgi:16S rRNA (adenine(1408)-N(1))-methyltransferase